MGTPILACGGRDMTALGGIVTGARQVFAEGQPIAVMGDMVTSHPHGNVPMAGTVMVVGAPTVFCGGMPVARLGDTVSPPCAEPILPSVTSVFVA